MAAHIAELDDNAGKGTCTCPYTVERAAIYASLEYSRSLLPRRKLLGFVPVFYR